MKDEAESMVVVKNTFLEEVSHGSACNGTLTAPASLAGRMRTSVVAEVSGKTSAGSSAVSQRKATPHQTGESDSGDTETTASTPPSSAGLPCLWPATPASPGAPVRISLVELMGDAGLAAALPTADAPGRAADLAAVAAAAPAHRMVVSPPSLVEPPACGYSQVGCWDAVAPETAWEFSAPAYSPPPPPESPKLPAHLESHVSIAAPPQEPAGRIFACVANAPAPKCAPPCAPAPAAAPAVCHSADEASPPGFVVATPNARQRPAMLPSPVTA